jgi:NTE family protein
MKPRIGLALSGGGSKGAFTVGVLKVLDQLLDPTPYPVISGTSTGSLIGTMLTTNQFARLIEIYSKVQTENIVNPHHAFVAGLFGPEAVLFASALIGGRAIFDQSALAATIEANVDFDRIKSRADQTRLIYNTVCLQSGELATFDNKTHTAAQLSAALLASASMPVLMDPVVIEVDGTSFQYADGGVREFLPLRAVFGSGFELDHVIAISTAPLEPKRQTGSFDAIKEILARTIDLLDSEVGGDDYVGAQSFNALLRMIDNAVAAGVSRTTVLRGIPQEIRSRLADKRAVPITFIGPAKHIDMDSLEFDPAAMRKLMKQGVDTAKKIVPGIVAALGG